MGSWNTDTIGGNVYISGFACASPDYCIDQQEALRHLLDHYGPELSDRSVELLEQFLEHPSIERRHFAISDPRALFTEDPDERMERFRRRSVELGTRASRQALEAAGVAPSDVAAIVVNTCTGYLCPGISNYLIEELELSKDLPAYDLVGSGCGGAVPNLEMCRPLAAGNPNGVVLSVSVEICSATFQMSDDPALLLSNALFGDGAAAAVVRTDQGELELGPSYRLHEPRYRDDIRYVYRNGQLHNQISISLPAKSSRVVNNLVDRFFEKTGLHPEDVPHWALHPGGERIINRLGERIGLSEGQLQPVRCVLREYGNLSSVSVWFVLRHIMDQGVRPGERCMMLSFGAGLSAHAILLRRPGT